MERTKKIAIHQPNFIPWPGYFTKIKAVDIFVLLDTAEYTKNSFINRNRILVNEEPQWLTIPVKYRGFSKKPIVEILISKAEYNPESILKTLNQHYRNYPFFELIFPDLNTILLEAKLHNSVSELNKQLIIWICMFLKIKTTMIDASKLDLPYGSATETLIAICERCYANQYLSGSGGKNYLKEELFEQAGIRLQYLNSSQEVDKWQGLSILHWLFLSGPGIKI